MIYIDSGAENAPFESQQVGFYFKPSSHVCKHFIVFVTDILEGVKATAVIYEAGILQSDGNELLINNGDEVLATDTSLVCSIELYGKYFFPTFAENMQLYYDDSFYGGTQKSDEVMSIAEVVNFAIKLGLEKAKIKPY